MELKTCIWMAIGYTVTYIVEMAMLVLGTIAFYLLGWTALAVIATIITSVIFVASVFMCIFTMFYSLYDV